MRIRTKQITMAATFFITVYSFFTLADSDVRLLSGVQIDHPLTTTTRELLLNDIKALKILNTSEFRGFDFELLQKEIPHLTVLVNTGTPLVGSGYRNGGVNFTQDQAYILNQKKLSTYSRSQAILLRWHEALGALGYNDDNYLISIAIAQKLARPSTQFHPEIKKQLSDQLLQDKRKNNFKYRSSEGGATGVGGGGDGDIAEIKSELISFLNYLALEQQLGTPEYTTAVLNLAIRTPIESMEFERHYLSVLSYDHLKVGKNTFTDRLSILVDTKQWQPIDSLKGSPSKKNNDTLNRIIDVLEQIQQSLERKR